MFVNHSISGGATESRENSVAVSNLPSLGVVTITDEPAGNANFERRIAVKSSKVSEARSTTSVGKPDESPIRWDGCIRGKPTFGKRERDEFSKDSQPCCLKWTPMLPGNSSRNDDRPLTPAEPANPTERPGVHDMRSGRMNSLRAPSLASSGAFNESAISSPDPPTSTAHFSSPQQRHCPVQSQEVARQSRYNSSATPSPKNRVTFCAPD